MTVAACEPAKSHAFDLVEVERTEEQPAFLDSSIADSAVVKRQDAAEAVTDAGMSDSGPAVADASLQDGGIFECPTGRFEGRFQCDKADGVDDLVGTLEFTLTKVPMGALSSGIMDATAKAYVPTSADDQTPLIEWPAAPLVGWLYCNNIGVPPYFVLELPTLSVVWDLPGPGSRSVFGITFRANYYPAEDQEQGKDGFMGEMTTRPAPSCVGTVNLARP